MSFPSLRKLIVNSDADLPQLFNQLQDQISGFFNAVIQKPQLDSIPLSNISLKAGNNQIPHTLGKVLTNWTLGDVTAPAKIYRYAPSNSTTLFLNSDMACTINLIVS